MCNFASKLTIKILFDVKDKQTFCLKLYSIGSLNLCTITYKSVGHGNFVIAFVVNKT